jgi:hypothetical protein
MRPFHIRAAAATLGALGCIAFAPWAAFGAESSAQAFDLKSGQELTFAVTIADGKVTLGPPRAPKSG